MAIRVLPDGEAERSAGDKTSTADVTTGVQIDELREAVRALFHARQLLLDCDRAAALQLVGRFGSKLRAITDEAANERLQRQAELARADARFQGQRCSDLFMSLGIDVQEAEIDPAVDVISPLSIGWLLLPLAVARSSPDGQVQAA